ncbi:chemotaxis protein CheB [Ancylomarina longa]|uniref:protein-glutamate methylesterase n=1 Tax=Ancylomarina longa TaxID=2487017 RepID=A0A434AU66_9BACT|nr:chemotaxis protein CheB [Ancylomarina longa]RUT77953.1 chemotaxis protein CheB [Ancylomarina longa]
MNKVLVIGASYGGLEALKVIIPKFPKDISLAIIVVLHIGENNNDSFIAYLNSISKLQVKEAEEKENIKSGFVYFAPPNYHILIESGGIISLSTEAKVHHSRPSIDVLFESAAWCYKNKLIGIILTGLNQDGAEGLKQVKKYGGISIVEDPERAIASIMPLSAIYACKPDYILTIEDIAKQILKLL